ncbi:MAG: hypothetical protein KF716_29495 [Anaerolineae bacterium]|nr:hypothetical protein [Anaerolineae bacterium]
MSRWRFIIPILLVVLVGVLGAIYLSANLSASGGQQPVMPLDDAYIHFQYARAIAEGHPFRYNPDQPPTSGATSLLYPFVLALGYQLGWQGEALAWWAIGIGWLCWLGSALLLYFTLNRITAKLTEIAPSSLSTQHLALSTVLTVAFILTGSLDWAFMSGMETGLLIFSIFLTLYFCAREDRLGIVLAAMLTAIIRPEGLPIGVLAGIYAATLKTESPLGRSQSIKRWLLYGGLPLLAGLLQPLINWAVTGSLSATGLQAKSYFYNVPFDLSVAISQTLTTFLKSWAHLMWDASQPTLTSHAILLLPLGIVTLINGSVQSIRERRLTLPILIVAWMLCVTGIAATLETAFWQMGRYQQPAIALLYPLALLGLLHLRNLRHPLQLRWGVLGLILLQTVIAAVPYVQYYRDNVHEVASSQIPMANYVRDNVPATAVVGVHDIGVMRYLGGHTTYDVVGLTTPGAAQAWRGGPGTTYEQLRHDTLRPDYFAIYPDARSLTYFEGTGLFHEQIASFPSVLPQWYNVASATWTGQHVYRAEWSAATWARVPLQLSSVQATNGLALVDMVNVAWLSDEAAHQYQWQAVKRDGFASELRDMRYIACAFSAENAGCGAMDGGRILRGESMQITTQPNKPLLWIMRVHPLEAVELEVRVNDQIVAYPHIFAQAGQWLEVAAMIPASFITGDQTRFSLTISGGSATSAYLPFSHWFFQGDPQPDDAIQHPAPPAVFADKITLAGRQIDYAPSARTLTLILEFQHDETLGALFGLDAKLFVHLYDPQGKLMELPGAQYDGRLGSGTLPPANWLPGTLRETVELQLPPDLPAGTYRVAIGLYNPTGGLARYPVTGDGADSDRRLFIGEITVK